MRLSLSAGLPALAIIAGQFEHCPTFNKTKLNQMLDEMREEVAVILSIMGE